MEILKKAHTPFWRWIAAINLGFVGFTVVSEYFADLPGKSLFSLAVEMGAGAWWSGILLLAVSFLAYQHAGVSSGRNRGAWLSLAVLFLGLAWDEVGSFHERIGGRSYRALLPWGLLCAALLTLSLVALYRDSRSRRAARLMLGGTVLLGSIPLQEYFEFALRWPYWLWGLRMGAEEGSELFGITLFLVAAGRHEEDDAPAPAVAAPLRMRHPAALLIATAVLHVAASLFVPGLDDLDQRGNPAVFPPMALLFVLSCVSFQKYAAGDPRHRPGWLLLSLSFLAGSLGAVAAPSRWLYNPFSIYILLVPLILLSYARIRGRPSGADAGRLAVLVAAFLAGFAASKAGLIERGSAAHFMIPGVLACLMAWILPVGGLGPAAREPVPPAAANGERPVRPDVGHGGGEGST